MSSDLTLEDYLHALPEWNDDLKARSMFASFSQPRDVNPEAWDCRFYFWLETLTEASKRGLLSESVFSITNPVDLPFKFCRNQMTPLGLSDVMSEMKARGQLCDTCSFENSRRYTITDLILWNPLKQTWGWVTGGLSSSSSDSRLALTELLQSYALKVIEHVTKSSDLNAMAPFLTIKKLQEILNEVRRKENLPPIFNKLDLVLLVKYMRHKNLATVQIDPDKDDDYFIRVKLKHEKLPLAISEDHKNILRLEISLDRLFEGIKDLEIKGFRYKSEAGKLLKLNDKTGALLQLKKFKSIEQIRSQRLQSAAIMETMLMKIEGAHTDAEIFQAYKIGEGALKNALNQLPSTKSIDDVLLSIDEDVANLNTISEAISVSPVQEDDEKLLDELLSLQLEQLPSPPGPVVKAKVGPVIDEISELGAEMSNLEISSTPSRQPTSLLD